MKDDRLPVLHMLECAERIRTYTQLGRDDFLRDEKTQDAVLRNFEIIGEAANRVSEGTQRRAPSIPWSRLVGYRNVLIHQYEGVDLQLVWDRIEHDLPPLEAALRELLQSLDH